MLSIAVSRGKYPNGSRYFHTIMDEYNHFSFPFGLKTNKDYDTA
jgi:hypothetical protein